MQRIRRDDLPLIGSSRNFVGADNDDVDVSVFLFDGTPAPVPGHIAIRMTRFSSSNRDADAGT